MIFVTVGSQMPFDRLISTVDRWAGRESQSDVFAQIGSTTLVPEHLKWVPQLDPIEFREKLIGAALIISHAGMGSILTALEFDKPLLVMPRRGALRETRNDHQVAMARWLSDKSWISVALDEAELNKKLGALDELTAPGRSSRFASEDLLSTVRNFIAGS